MSAEFKAIAIIAATSEDLQEKGFVPIILRGDDEDWCKTYDFESVDIERFKNIHKLTTEKDFIYLGSEGGLWYILDQRIAADESSYLAPQSIGLVGLVEITHAIYYRFGHSII